MELDITDGINSEQRPKDGKIWPMFGAQRVVFSARKSGGNREAKSGE